MSFLFSPCKPCCVAVSIPSGDYIDTSCCSNVPSSIYFNIISKSGEFPDGYDLSVGYENYDCVKMNHHYSASFPAGHFWYKDPSYSGLSGPATAVSKMYLNKYDPNDPDLTDGNCFFDNDGYGCSYFGIRPEYFCYDSEPSGCSNFDLYLSLVQAPQYGLGGGTAYIKNCSCDPFYASGEIHFGYEFGARKLRYDFIMSETPCVIKEKICNIGTGDLYIYDISAYAENTPSLLDVGKWIPETGAFYFANIKGSGLLLRCNETGFTAGASLQYLYGDNLEWISINDYTKTNCAPTTPYSLYSPLLSYFKFYPSYEMPPMTGILLLSDALFDPVTHTMWRCPEAISKNLTATLTTQCPAPYTGTSVITYPVKYDSAFNDADYDDATIDPCYFGGFSSFRGSGLVPASCLGTDEYTDFYNAWSTNCNYLIYLNATRFVPGTTWCYHSCDPFYIMWSGTCGPLGQYFKLEYSE